MLDRLRDIMDEISGEYPVYQYDFFSPEELTFSENVRYICRTECPMYAKSWSCPPGCGTEEECRARCLSYEHGLIFSTVAEVEDVSRLEDTLPTRAFHTQCVRAIAEKIPCENILALSCESCEICKNCRYPDAPCAFPEKMLPCIEGYGIVVTALAEKLGMDFFLPGNAVLWFGMILF